MMVASGFAVALAAEGIDEATVGTATEAWYVLPDSDTCADADCSALPTSEYPKNTLHVGISGGTPTTATYVELDLTALPFGATVTGGTLELPVDRNTGDGSVRAAEAKLRVCQITGSLADTKASPDTPPETDCDAAAAKATYSAKPRPAFSVDLAPFVKDWSEGASAAVAILPAPAAVKASDTWHVAFFGKDYESGEQQAPPEESPAPEPPASGEDVGANDLAGDVRTKETTSNPPVEQPGEQQEPAPITASLTYEEEEFAAPPLAEPPPLEPELGPPPPAPEVGPIAAPAPEAAGPVPPKQEPAQEPEAAPVRAPEAAPDFIEVGYQYPIAWLMPLLLLVGFAMTGHSLTRNLEHPERALT
ncbi:hypothetical protein [Haloechinothrix salitolerans]|uniref:SipW-cognate class signal peptide n=1 Tax=Haloechinothrix salitolerans TaxID=926830 RepID=A0ABW2C4F7_9PSEU